MRRSITIITLFIVYACVCVCFEERTTCLSDHAIQSLVSIKRPSSRVTSNSYNCSAHVGWLMTMRVLIVCVYVCVSVLVCIYH